MRGRSRAIAVSRGRALSVPSGAAVWTPASLFTTESGDYWLPTPGYVFTDAGTTPATADGDALYQINGQRGSINLVQTSAAARPLLQLAEIAGQPAFQTDGAGDCFGDSSVVLPSPGEFTFFAALTYVALGAYHNLFELGVDNDPMLWISNTDVYELDIGGSGDPATNLPGCTAASAQVGWNSLIARDRGANRQIVVNGSVVASSSSGGTFKTGTHPISVLNRSGGSTFSGTIACMGWISRRITDDELTSLEAYLAGTIS